MCITEYNEAETMRMFEAEGRRKGIQEGQKEGREQGKLEMILQLIRNGLITLEAGAEQLHMSKIDLEKYL